MSIINKVHFISKSSLFVNNYNKNAHTNYKLSWFLIEFINFFSYENSTYLKTSSLRYNTDMMLYDI